MRTIETLTKKIQKHCPELMELSFGCEVNRGAGDHVQEIVVSHACGKVSLMRRNKIGDWLPFEVPDELIESAKWKILGHPIQLQHVLIAIRASVDENGPIQDELLYSKYNLSKPFTEQSEELYEWLNKIIS